MARTIVYYVSGHGFGHARRTAEILRSLTARDAEVRVVVRTAAPPFIFRNIPGVSVEPPAAGFDPGAVERDPLCIDPRATLDNLARTLRARGQIVEAEADFVRSKRARLVVADLPFLAGDVARAAGVACVGVGNFTWDWIFEPFAATEADRAMIREVRECYQRFDELLHLPLGHDVSSFKRVTEVPLVASRSRRAGSDILQFLGVAPDEARPRVLIAMRGGLGEQAVFGAGERSGDMVFILPTPATDARVPGNVRAIDANGGDLDFTDLLSVCDAVVSKVGYGILADSIVAKAALLYPRREGFREDELSIRECPRYLRMRELPREDFTGGRWHTHLCALLAQAPPRETLPTDGEAVVAHALIRRLT